MGNPIPKAAAVLKVGDTVTKPLKDTAKNINVLNVHTQLASNQMKTCSENTAKMKFNMDSLIQLLTKSIINYTKESIVAAHAQAVNDSTVVATIKEKTNATQKQIDSIFKQIYAQQNIGVVSDRVQKAGAQQLAEYVGNAESIKNLIPAMNNLLVAKKQLNGTSSDAAEIANIIGLAMKGKTGELERSGIILSDTDKQVLKNGSEKDKTKVINKAINNKVGNYNEQMAKTDPGAIQKANNQFQALKVTLGQMVLPHLVKFAKWFSEHQPQIKKIVKTIGKIVVTACETIYAVITKIFDFAEKHPKLTKFLIVSLAMFLILKKAIMGCIGVISIITFVLGLLGVSFEISPVLIFVAAIAALIAVIALLITFWDEVTKAVKNFFSMLEKKFPFLSKLMPGLEGIGNLLTATGHPILGRIVGSVAKLGKGKDKSPDKKSSKPKKKTPYDWGDLSNYMDEYGKRRNGKLVNDLTLPLDKGEKKRRKALGKSDWKSALDYINGTKSEKSDLFKGLATPVNKSKKVTENKNITFGNIYITAKSKTANEIVNEIMPVLKLKLANI